MEQEETINLLDGHRFDKEANLIYKVPADRLSKRLMGIEGTGETIEVIDFEHEETLDMIKAFVRHHKTKQVPRLKQLKRYYLADNNIKYRPSKPNGRSDNRISSDYGRFIVNFKRGVLLGNPVTYNGDEGITEKVNEFNASVNEDYHNQLMADDAFTFGRAYELVYRNELGEENLAKLDVMQTFVIYDSKVNGGSIAGIRDYQTEFNGKINTHVDVYANDGFLYLYEAEGDDLERIVLKSSEPTHFNAVQINEWINNEERSGDYENVLDQIDAYDLSQSEMANFQQDSSEAYLVIKGNPDTGKDEDGENSSPDVLQAMINARMLVLGDKKIYNDSQQGSEPDAYYLKKEYDTAGIEAYNNRTVADILRFTSLVDFTDENMGGNQSGVGFKFKGWGNDNDRKNKERMIKKAIMRRLRLLTHSWSIKDGIKVDKSFGEKIKSLFTSNEKERENLYERVNDIKILFTPNVPQSDEEIMKVIAGMNGIVSDQTLFSMASRLTGVSQEEETKRVNAETPVIPDEVYDFDKKVEEVDKEKILEDKE